MSTTTSSTGSRKRIRLAPDIRSEKILDAALVEFARQGYAATRIEDIARGAGLAKSGFYAHFHSKEEAFRALLTNSLIMDTVIPFGAEDTVDDFIERFLDVCYVYLGDPRRQAVLRVLLTESQRVPELVDEWRRQVADPASSLQLRELHAAFKRGQVADTPILQDFSFAFSPLLHWVLAHAPHDCVAADKAEELARHRGFHRQMMKALLQAPPA